MKFLVLGACGMAGHTISLYLKEAGHDVFGFDRRKSPLVPSAAGDAFDTALLATMIADGGYDVVINCIGVLNKAAEDNKAAAALLNGYLPHFLAKVTAGTKTRVFHMSTDCVFSGKRGSYRDTDMPDGETFYDRSKALGELNDEKNLTLRDSIVGPDINENGIGLLNWFMKSEGTVRGYTSAIWTGVTTLQLAMAMEKAAKSGLAGLYNCVPKSPVTKYELLCHFNKYLRGGEIEIIPDDSFVCDKSLIASDGIDVLEISDYEKMTADLAKWMKAHRDLYPHYNIK